MKIQLFVCALLALFLAGCSVALPSPSSYRPSEKERISDLVLKRAALRTQQKTGLIPCGTGGQMMGEIKMLALSFDYCKPMDKPLAVEQGRALLLAAVDTLIRTVNEEGKIRSYLYHYPFEPSDVEIRIFLRNKNGTTVPLGELVVLSAIDGIINYEIDDPQVSPLFVTIATETYEEALQKLRQSGLRGIG